MKFKLLALCLSVLLWTALPSRAAAGYRLMEIERIIGGVSGDATAQAIELTMRGPNQTELTNARLRVYDANGKNPILLIQFPTDLALSSSNQHILIASPAFRRCTTAKCNPDYFLENLIPESYLAAGRIAYEDTDTKEVLWSFAYGGSNYKGSNAASSANVDSGNFGAPVATGLDVVGINAYSKVSDPGSAPQSSLSDYALDDSPSVFENNNGESFQIAYPVGDISGDGRPDLLMYASASGSTQILTMEGTVVTGTFPGPILPAGYTPVSVYHFDPLSTEPQILVSDTANTLHLIFLQNGEPALDVTGPTLPPGFTVAAVRDLNHNHNAQLVAYSESNGATRWLSVTGTNFTATLAPTIPAGWLLGGVGDFNGDRMLDYALYNPTTGQVAIWFLNGPVVAGMSSLGPVLPAGFGVSGSADYNGDGKADIIFYNPANGETRFCFISDGVVAGELTGPTIPDGFLPVPP